MYLTVIAWIYVVLMMSIAEATSTNGTVLGALMTFLLYGILPLSIVMYLMGAPSRRRAIKAQERQAREVAKASAEPATPSVSNQPDAGGHAPSAANATGNPMPTAPVREKP
jgi:hypothetical protein